jgi:hypothetical protein
VHAVECGRWPRRSPRRGNEGAARSCPGRPSRTAPPPGRPAFRSR